MPNFWETKEFQELSEEWNRKLRESGFKDAERDSGNGERVLLNNADHAFSRRPAVEEVRENKRQYFVLIAHFVEREVFEDEADRIIMTLTADDCMIKEISKRLKELGLHKHNRDTIRYVRRRYEHRWGIKSWKPEEMISRKVRT